MGTDVLEGVRGKTERDLPGPVAQGGWEGLHPSRTQEGGVAQDPQGTEVGRSDGGRPRLRRRDVSILQVPRSRRVGGNLPTAGRVDPESVHRATHGRRTVEGVGRTVRDAIVTDRDRLAEVTGVYGGVPRGVGGREDLPRFVEGLEVGDNRVQTPVLFLLRPLKVLSLPQLPPPLRVQLLTPFSWG